MTQKPWFLAALAVALCSASSPAAYAPVDDLSPVVPADCQGFVSIRVASLCDKFDCKKPEAFPPFAAIGKQFGMPLADLDRLTVFFPAGEKGEPLLVLHGKSTLPKKDLLAACVPDAQATTLGGKEVHANADQAVWFASATCLVGGPKEAMTAYLKGLKPGDEKPDELAKGLALAQTRDLAGWAKTAALAGMEPLPLLGVESATVALDFGKKVDFGLRVGCGTERQARDVAQSVRGVVNVARGQMLMVAGMVDASAVIGEQMPAELKAVSWELVRKAEKGLAAATVKAEKSAVVVAGSLPIEAKLLRAEIEKAIALQGGVDECESCFCLPFAMRAQTCPAPRGVLELPAPPAPIAQPAQVVAVTMPTPTASAPKMPSAQPTGTHVMQPPPPPGVTVASPYPHTGPVWQPMPGPGPIQAMAAQPMPCPAPVQQVAYPVVGCGPAAPPAAMKLTVANVRKEAAQLFEMAEDGKMRFVQKLAAGEAIDVKTSSDKRLVAVFGESAESHDPREAKGVWLLRPATAATPQLTPVGLPACCPQGCCPTGSCPAPMPATTPVAYPTPMPTGPVPMSLPSVPPPAPRGGQSN